MNLVLLARQLAELQRQLRETVEQAAAVEAAIAEARANIDPFARHVFQARHDYQRTAAGDTKSGKRSQEAARQSCIKAIKLGWRGGLKEWFLVLTAYAANPPAREFDPASAIPWDRSHRP